MMGRRKRALLLGSLLSAAAPAWMAPAFAQDATAEDRADSEIVVTARRREESTQEVPGVVQAFGGQMLEDVGASSIEDVVGMAAGVEFVNSTGEVGGNDIIIRGGGAGRFLNTDSSVGLYENGAYISGGNVGGRTLNESDLFDIQRIEILKGPQGALLGRNALGGSVNAISRRPSLTEASGAASVGEMEGDGWLAEASYERPLVENVLAFRLAGRTSHRDEGFFYNPYLDSYLDAFDENIGRAVLVARFSPDVELTLQADFYEIDRAGSLRADTDVVDDVYNWPMDDQNRGSQTQYNGYANLTWDMDFATFTATINSRQREGILVEDMDQGVASSDPFDPAAQSACFATTVMMVSTVAPNQRCVLDTIDSFDITTYTAYLQGQAGMLDWIIGADYLDAQDEYSQQTTGQDVNSYILTTTGDVNSLALWGGAQLQITDPFSIGLEVRYTDEDKEQASRATYTFGAPAGSDLFNNALLTEFSRTTFAAFARYELSDRIALYGRVGSGFRSGGLNTDARDLVNPTTSVLAVVPDSYLPERALSYEVGLRTQPFGGSTFFNVTAFYIEYQDFLQNLNNGITGVNRIMYVYNTGDAEVHGVEYEMGGRWRDVLGGSLNWTLGAVNADSEVLTGALSGTQVTRLPEWSFTGTALYRHGLVGDLDWRVGLRYSHQYGGYQTAGNVGDLQEPTVFNLTGGIDSPHWSAAVTIENLTDEDEPLNYTSANIISPRTPRNWTVRLTRRF
jgi:iron complex outermembrane receptor protein